MRKSVTIVLIACFAIASFGGINVSGDGEPAVEIGQYERVTGSGDLSGEHVEESASGVRVEGPLFTDTLRVAKGFLESEVGEAWAANKAFVLENGEVVVAGRTVEFSPLEIDPSPVFTMGGLDQIQFQDRPMWVSTQQDEPGATITLDMEDGDTTGQEVFIAKNWLWAHGIHRPVVVHEDGTELSAVPTQQRDGWVIDMHHFSYVEISPTELVVFSRQEGLVVPHTGEVRWYEDDKRLEIDVGGPNDCASHVIRECTEIDQDILVDKDWLDMRIKDLALRYHPWIVTEYQGDDYYQVNLTAKQTPTTLLFELFTPSVYPAYTRGSPDSIRTWAVNETVFDTTVPMLINASSGQNHQINIVKDGLYRVEVDQTWLLAQNISYPHFLVDGEEGLYFESHDGDSFIIELRGSGNISVLPEAAMEYLREIRQQEVVLNYESLDGTFAVWKMAYMPWVEGSIDVYLKNITWGDNYWGGGNLSKVEFLVDGEVIDSLLASSDEEMIFSGLPIDLENPGPFVVALSGDQGGDEPDVQYIPLPRILSEVIEDTGIFQEMPYSSCSWGDPWYKVKNRGYSRMGHENDHTHSGTGTAFTGTHEHQGAWNWFREYEFGTCGVEGTDTLRYEVGFTSEGRTLWNYNSDAVMGSAFHILGDISEGTAAGSGFAQLKKPWLHTQNPEAPPGVPVAGEQLAHHDGIFSGKRAQANCPDWRTQLAWLALASLASATHIWSGILVSGVSALDTACSTNWSNRQSDMDDNPGGGVRLDGLSTWNVEREGGGRSVWDTITDTGYDFTFPSINQAGMEVTLEFYGSGNCPSPGCTGGWESSRFTNYSTGINGWNEAEYGLCLEGFCDDL